jgi:GDPmannose 4,6-dehydratase
MLQREQPRDYVIASGSTHSVRDFVIEAFRAAEEITGKVLDWQDYVKVNAQLFRPAEVPHLLGDATRALTELGWKPQVSFRELVRMMVEHDLSEVGQ